jgi:hypothetical protein
MKFILEIDCAKCKTIADRCHRAREVMAFVIGRGRYDVNLVDGGPVNIDGCLAGTISWKTE